MRSGYEEDKKRGEAQKMERKEFTWKIDQRNR